MAIKVKCSCGIRFQAKDQLAGKKVKCPKCNNPLRIPAANEPAKESVPAGPAASKPAVDPMAALLDEIGVTANAPTTGPICPGCQASIKPNDILCIQCGFDLQTGQRIESVSYGEVDEMAGMTETEKLLHKAEKEIDDTPVSSDNVDFGDGAGAYLVAAVVVVAAFLIIAVTLTSTILLKMFGDHFGAGPMAALSMTFIFSIGFVWISISGFIDNPKVGVCCVFIPIFPLIYAIRRKQWMPMALLIPGYLFCFVILMAWLSGADVYSWFFTE